MPKTLSFSFHAYSQSIASLIAETDDQHAFVVGLAGPWGSGKTTLMEQILSEFQPEDYLPIKFNAWAHSKQDSIWRSLFVSIVTALRQDVSSRLPATTDGKLSAERVRLESILDDAEKSLYTAFTKETPGEMQVDFGKLAKSGAKIAMNFVPWGDLASTLTNLIFNKATDEEEDENDGDSPKIKGKDFEKFCGVLKRDIVRRSIVQIQSMEQFRRSIEVVIGSTLNDNRKLIITIDDIDRCLPEQGLEVFEAIKLYLDLPKSIFIVAMDQDLLQHALDLRYKQIPQDRRITSDLYAEKMIDLSFMIPPPDEKGFGEFIEGLPSHQLLVKYKQLAKLAIPRNPRTWQRFANRLTLHTKILANIAEGRVSSDLYKSLDIEPSFFKLQLIGFRWPGVMRALESFDKLLVLEACVLQANVETDNFLQRAAQKSPQIALRETSTSSIELPEAIWPYLGDLGLFRLLNCSPRFSQEAGAKSVLDKIFSLELPPE